MAREYSIWNGTVAALQFWTADLKAHVLSSAIEQVYNAFFYTTSIHLLCQQSEEVLFSHLVTTLNAAFESKLTLGDECYEGGSKNVNIPTLLRCAPRIYHVSSDDNISFDPPTLHSTGISQPCHKPVQCQLSFSSSDDEDISTVDIPSPSSTEPLQNPKVFPQHSKCTLTIHEDLDDNEEEEYFQTVSLDDDHWTREEIQDRHLCINEHLVPHLLCPYPCPYMDYTHSAYYDTLDLSDISKFEDLMTTLSDKDIPVLDEDIR